MGAQCPTSMRCGFRELFPLMAQRLCAQLHNEPAQPLPYDAVELISVQSWNDLMRLICQGTIPLDALHQVGVPVGVFRSYMRTEPRLRSRWNIARGIARRRNWPLDEILDDIANSDLSLRGICACHGVSYQRFLRLSQDPYVFEQYLEAKQAQRLRLDDANESTVTAALDGGGAASRKTLRQTMRVFNQTATKIRGMWPRRLSARMKRAASDPASRLEAAAAARRRAAKALR